MNSAAEKIERAITRMTLVYPWWASCALHLQRRPARPEDGCTTMGTDGTWLIYDEAFTEKLSNDECTSVIMHEVAHCILLHPMRRGTREPLRWNIAADQAANALLEADGIVLPANGVPAAKSLDLTAEELYAEVKLKKIPIDVFTSGEFGDKEDIQPLGEREWKSIIATTRGTMPQALKRTVEKAQEPKIDWREELARFCSARVKDDCHTWSRQARRIDGLPGWRRTPSSKIAVVIDTSGSIDEEMLRSFRSEISAILALHAIQAVVISADAAVHQIIEPGESIPDDFVGGGGTDFCPALELSKNLLVDGVIYMTDGCGKYPSTEILPTLWALTKNSQTPPWGQTIKIGE